MKQQQENSVAIWTTISFNMPLDQLLQFEIIYFCPLFIISNILNIQFV